MPLKFKLHRPVSSYPFICFNTSIIFCETNSGVKARHEQNKTIIIYQWGLGHASDCFQLQDVFKTLNCLKTS